MIGVPSKVTTDMNVISGTPTTKQIRESSSVRRVGVGVRMRRV